ncbi:hypothetical protein DL95DRAFT_459245 [Leptodontidium sp. 2 PMI_412]|nr:hypothetical protein DL95DRAFT_459245 [Leptodontidium sp. 2 PMI_412]
MEVDRRVQLPPEALTVARALQRQLPKPIYGISRIQSDAIRVYVLTDIWTCITAQTPMFRLTSARLLTKQIINEIETRNATNASGPTAISRACIPPAQADEWHTTFLGHLLDYTDNNYLPWPARKIVAMMQKTLSTGLISMAPYDANPEYINCLERIWAGIGMEGEEYRLLGIT